MTHPTPISLIHWKFVATVADRSDIVSFIVYAFQTDAAFQIDVGFFIFFFTSPEKAAMFQNQQLLFDGCDYEGGRNLNQRRRRPEVCRRLLLVSFEQWDPGEDGLDDA